MADTRAAARAAATDTYVPSVLDRLTAPESFGSGPSLGHNLTQIIEGVRRDVEDLLNTHQTHQGMPAEFVELHDSIMTYGLPDFSGIGGTKARAALRICLLVESVVNRFEPRLKDVRALPSDQGAGSRAGLTVRINIDARLRVEPYPDVTFESVIELTTGKTSIRAGDS
jgi:type VI secretion system protein ImpF